MSGTSPTTDGRLQWMDLLRGAAVLLIIAFHAAVYPPWFGMEMPQTLQMANIALTPFRIPTLLVLSGMLLPRALGKPLSQYYAGKARNILWPYLVWTVLTALVVDTSRLTDPVAWYAGMEHLWFLSTLLVCYAVAPAVRRIPGWLIAVALWGLWLIATPTIPGVQHWLWYGAYFFLGVSVARLDVTRLPWWAAASMGATALGGIVLAVTGPSTGYLWKPHWIVISLAGVGALLWVTPRIPRSRLTSALESVGRQSLVYYVVHIAAIVLAVRALEGLGSTGGWLAYIAIVAAGIGAPFLLTRIPGAHWLFAFGRKQPRRDPDPQTTGSLIA